MVELGVIRDLVAIFGVIAGFSYYVLTVRNNQKNQELMLKAQQQTLQTRQAQLYMWFASQMTSESWADHMLNVLNSKWSNYEQFQKWYTESPKNPISWGIVLNYFENAGVLVKSELLDIDMVATGFAGITRKTWEKVIPIVQEQRTEWNQPRLASEFEFLYNRLITYMDEHSEYKT